MSRTVRVFKDTQQQWRWHVVESANGEIEADSSEGYVRRVDAISMAKALFPDTPFDIEDDE